MDASFDARMAHARHDMQGKLERRRALTASLAQATSDPERRALLSLYESTEFQAMLARAGPRTCLEDYEILARIGRGGFGEVTLARREGQLFALKRIPRIAAAGHSGSLKHILSERNALVLTSSSSQSPWTTTLYHAFQTDEDLFFVTNFACGGDLMQLLIAKDVLPEPLVRQYAAELVEAIDSCHRVGYMHRDIKPDNVLLDQQGHLCLGDLGLSTSILGVEEPLPITSSSSSSSSAPLHPPLPPPTPHPPPRKTLRVFSQCGTPDYISPEVLGTGGYGLDADWWSLGAVLYECLLGFCPFFADTPVATCTRILRWSTELTFPPSRVAHLSPPCLDFLRSLLREASGRLGSARGAAEVREHPWLKGMSWAALRSVDVRTLGGELPIGGQAEAVLQRLCHLPRGDPAFPATLRLALSHFDDFDKLSEHDARVALGGGGTEPSSQAASAAAVATPHALVPLLQLHPSPGDVEQGGAGGAAGASALINSSSARSATTDSARRRLERLADFTFQRPLSSRRAAQAATRPTESACGGGGV